MAAKLVLVVDITTEGPWDLLLPSFYTNEIKTIIGGKEEPTWIFTSIEV